jgi:ABC-type transport system involved in multi-copper enzyme maturation permease subunit
MTRIIRAELQRLVRRRTLIIAVAGSLLFAVVATLTVFSSAKSTGIANSRQGGTTLAKLAGSGGATQAFAVGASFAGFLVFVTFIAVVAAEFSGGTFRALLLRDPRRLRMIVGKVIGLLIVAAGVALLAEVFSAAMSLLLAPSRDVSTTAWFSFAALGDAVRDFATVFAGVAGWAVFGATLAVIFRSAPLALGVGFAWAGPFENIVVDSWDTGYRFFPGQVLASLIRGGTVELGFARALVTGLLYTGVATAATLLLISRRDVTA